MRYHFGLGVGHLYSRQACFDSMPQCHSSLGEIRTPVTDPDGAELEEAELGERVEDNGNDWTDEDSLNEGSDGIDSDDDDRDEDADDDELLAMDKMYGL